MGNWELELGTYPGICLGIRHYHYDKAGYDIVLYLPFVCLILNIYGDEGK